MALIFIIVLNYDSPPFVLFSETVSSQVAVTADANGLFITTSTGLHGPFPLDSRLNFVPRG